MLQHTSSPTDKYPLYFTKLTVPYFHLKPTSQFLKFLDGVFQLLCLNQDPSKILYVLPLTALSLKIFELCNNPLFLTFL